MRKYLHRLAVRCGVWCTVFLTEQGWIANMPTQITSLRYTLSDDAFRRSQLVHAPALPENHWWTSALVTQQAVKSVCVPSLSDGLSGLDPPELPQPGHPFWPEGPAAGGGARGGAPRGPGGVSAGRGAEGGMWKAEGGDEDAAEPEAAGQGQCCVWNTHSSIFSQRHPPPTGSHTQFFYSIPVPAC